MEARGVAKNILVVGYPKSGNTWVTRLVAELIGCPVAGFWRSAKREIAVEGEDRVSDFRCYKSHHQHHDLTDCPGGHNAESEASRQQLIYVLRDPRDVTVSGAHHFRFQRFPLLQRLCLLLPRGGKLYHHTLYPLLVPERYRLDQMTEAVLHGAANVHPWCRVSWKEHALPYLHDAGALLVRYEDLLEQPEAECERILRHLGIERDADFVRDAIERQSFERKREQLLNKGETGKAKFLRVGKSGQWRDKLSPQNLARFEAELGPELRQFSYPPAELEPALSPQREPRLSAATVGALQLGSAGALLASWWASHVHPTAFAWPSLLVPIFLFASLVWLTVILNDLARRATLRPALLSLTLFILSASAVGVGAQQWAGPPNPWRQFGVSARWHRPAGAARMQALYTISHQGRTIATAAALPERGDDWSMRCEDVDRDGLLDVIVEDGRGRSVLTFRAERNGQPPAFQVIERTWSSTMQRTSPQPAPATPPQPATASV